MVLGAWDCSAEARFIAPAPSVESVSSHCPLPTASTEDIELYLTLDDGVRHRDTVAIENVLQEAATSSTPLRAAIHRQNSKMQARFRPDDWFADELAAPLLTIAFPLVERALNENALLYDVIVMGRCTNAWSLFSLQE